MYFIIFSKKAKPQRPFGGWGVTIALDVLCVKGAYDFGHVFDHLFACGLGTVEMGHRAVGFSFVLEAFTVDETIAKLTYFFHATYSSHDTSPISICSSCINAHNASQNTRPSRVVYGNSPTGARHSWFSQNFVGWDRLYIMPSKDHSAD